MAPVANFDASRLARIGSRTQIINPGVILGSRSIPAGRRRQPASTCLILSGHQRNRRVSRAYGFYTSLQPVTTKKTTLRRGEQRERSNLDIHSTLIRLGADHDKKKPQYKNITKQILTSH